MYQVIADERDFIVINKSAEVHFHSQDGTAGVVAQAEADLGIKLYAVHRLDTMTSGLIILAKSSAVAAEFTRMFSAHLVQKYYLALAIGKPKKKQGWVIGDMAKSRRSMHKLLRSTENPAITQFFSHSIGEGERLYLLKPHSGKTHQLRVALASIGTPILGDTLYGGAEADRGYLHAYCLDFQYLEQDYRYTVAPPSGELFNSAGVAEQLIAWQQPADLVWPQLKKAK
ncbi:MULTISPECIES: TIGR01621 family pseudouridine synthase [unclassified Shewanella]|uniref:TIGR01621 family pseudouridine synthase n=1 Tax=unclassified Shewanella TaxID=196818 RepID=UPI001BC6BF5D|nr:MULTISPECIES: TIGR01621 family pseudouridine synthase [unclassified Shewanella]GIU14426.1 RNA pseudouridine synthase [Shewanella sp. MBTL60-112-B1]GIU29549.1 RNA pseudouridine synthase [Shewanella sp. MBTL60-112-B2]